MSPDAPTPPDGTADTTADGRVVVEHVRGVEGALREGNAACFRVPSPSSTYVDAT